MTPPTDTLSIAQGGVKPRLSDPFRSSRTERLIRLLLVSAGISGSLSMIVIFGRGTHLRAPDFDLFVQQPLALKVHVAAAVLAFSIGLVLMMQPKGHTLHRVLGWIWVAAMLTTAISSFLFPAVMKGRLDPIHVLSAYALIAVPMGFVAARRHDIRSHRRVMTNLFMFALVVAGSFTFIPGRLMWRIFFA